MTFEEWNKNHGYLMHRIDDEDKLEIWQAAQEAERNRINALVIKVRAEGSFAGTAWWDSAEEIRRLIHAPT